MISKIITTYQNPKCFNCGRTGHLRRDCKHYKPIINVLSWNHPNSRPQTSVLCKQYGKGSNEPMSVEQKQKQGNLLSLKNSLRGFLQAPRSNVVQSFPVTVENRTPKENQKIHFLLLEECTLLNDRIIME